MRLMRRLPGRTLHLSSVSRQAADPMAPRRKCNVCGSQQWRKEPATGLVVCSEGHVLQVCASKSGAERDPSGSVMPWNRNIAELSQRDV